MASVDIAGMLFFLIVTDILSILRHKKVSAFVLGSFYIVLFIGKDALFIVLYITDCYWAENHSWSSGYSLRPSGSGRWFKSGVQHLQCLRFVSYLWDQWLDRPRAAPVIGLRTPVCPRSLSFMDILKTSPAGVRGY